jgi:hypothetical protein
MDAQLRMQNKQWEVHNGEEYASEMAGATGLEPATFGVTGRRSNQLSYAPAGARLS